MKRMFVLGAACLFATASFAQHVDFGLKGGVNLANFKVENDDNTDSRTGFYAGGLAHIHLNKSWALQPEVMYSSQGAEIDNAKWKANYINIPVLVQYMFGNGFRLQTGPQLGILTSAKLKQGGNETDLDDVFKTTDFSWSFGASYITPVGLGVDARYNLGISDISESNTEVKNRVWQFGLFYQFKHRR